MSPAFGTSERPMISTGTLGPAVFIFLPLSSVIARIRPTLVPAMITSPALSVPFETRSVATGPRPRSSFASTTVPFAALSGFALSSSISAVRMTISRSSSIPSPRFAEIGHTIVLPPHSSGTSSYSVSCCLILSGFAPSTSILLTATTIGTSAAFAWFIASIVCGMMPSSAATTRITTSVTCAPRARMDVNAS